MIIKDDVTRLMFDATKPWPRLSLSSSDSSRFPAFIVLLFRCLTSNTGNWIKLVFSISQRNKVGTVYQFVDFDDEDNYTI